MTSVPQVSVVEYGVGNIGSVINACRRAGIEPRVASSGAELSAQSPTHILLPGVGAVGHALDQLRQRGFEPLLRDLVIQQQRPILGICVGMQMLAEICEEFGEHRGLGWIPGRVASLREKVADLFLPHVGWNNVHLRQAADPVLAGLDGEHFYFVHSFAMDCPDDYVLCQTEYGGHFISGVRCGNVYGVQFHPEKSAGTGVRLLSNFFGIR